MNKNFILRICFIVVGLLVGIKLCDYLVSTTKLKPYDSVVVDSFRIGCEFGVLKSCNPGHEDECKKYCAEVISNNRSLIDLLKNKKK